jgi:hypothetical protein
LGVFNVSCSEKDELVVQITPKKALLKNVGPNEDYMDPHKISNNIP